MPHAARQSFAVRLVAFGICVPALCASGAYAQSETPAARASESIDDVVTRSAALSFAPGAVVAIVWGDSVVFLKAFGTTGPAADEAPLRADEVFHAGALTELVNGIAAAQLASTDEGLLTRPIGEAVPELPQELRAITLDQLLSHTSGLAHEVTVPGRGGADDLGAAARQLTRLDRMADPGSVYSSSLPARALVGLALERMGGRPYAQLLTELVFEPLGMVATTVAFDVARAHITQGYRPSASPDAPLEAIVAHADSALLVPVQGLYSTASDLARMAAALMNDGIVEGVRALAPGVAAGVLNGRAAVPGSDDRAGLGVRLSAWLDRPLVRVAGGLGGHAILLSALPEEDIAVVVVTNKTDALLSDVPDFIFRRLLDLRDPPRRTPTLAVDST
ncbi:MAG: serine hydrolase domain-containing protein, partial [Alphaproteobacteria bacterium]